MADLAAVIARAARDTGERTSLDDVMVRFGYERAELEAELHDDLLAGQE